MALFEENVYQVGCFHCHVLLALYVVTVDGVHILLESHISMPDTIPYFKYITILYFIFLFFLGFITIRTHSNVGESVVNE